MISRVGAAIAASLLVAAPAVSQDRAEPKLVENLAKCLEIREDARRLACTDVAARQLIDATRRKDLVMVDAGEVAKTKRSLFGFSLPKIGLFGRDGPDKPKDEIEEIEAPITRVAELGYGKYAITVEGDARWHTTEAWDGTMLPKVGQRASIKRGALGGYFLKVGRTRAVRAIRVG